VRRYRAKRRREMRGTMDGIDKWRLRDIGIVYRNQQELKPLLARRQWLVS
jgi:hypothetical protein